MSITALLVVYLPFVGFGCRFLYLVQLIIWILTTCVRTLTIQEATTLWVLLCCQQKCHSLSNWNIVIWTHRLCFLTGTLCDWYVLGSSEKLLNRKPEEVLKVSQFHPSYHMSLLCVSSTELRRNQHIYRLYLQICDRLFERTTAWFQILGTCILYTEVTLHRIHNHFGLKLHKSLNIIVVLGLCFRAAGSANNEAVDRLPTSATCMNLLKLPPYQRFVLPIIYIISVGFYSLRENFIISLE